MGKRAETGWRSKGGRARASVLTPEERREIARQAAAARWGKPVEPESAPPQPPPPQPSASDVPYSMFQGTLALGGTEIQVHVLNDDQRVVTQREMVRLLSGGRESGNLKAYLDGNPLTSGMLTAGAYIEFKTPGNPVLSHGYEATFLIEMCSRYSEAREQGLLRAQQIPLAKKAEAILRACAKVGIIALIDEATGYQHFREKRALQIKLQAFIADELQEWAKAFPDEFWHELARLEGVHYSPKHRPIRWGKYVMAFVYDAIDEDIGNTLRELNPNPQHRRNHHQWLKDFGKERLQQQLWQVITIMKLCKNMDDFRAKFDHVFKKTPLQLTMFDTN